MPDQGKGKALVASPSPPEQAFPDISAWKLYFDGALNLNGSGAGLILVSTEGEKTTYALRFDFKATNNEAEYEALMTGPKLAEELEILGS